MKYAIVNARGGINRVADSAPASLPEGVTSVEITDEQAALITAGRSSTPIVTYAFLDGELVTLREKIEADRLAAMTPEQRAVRCVRSGKNWVAAVIPVDDQIMLLSEVMKHQANPSARPKLFALYQWTETVKAIALSGSVEFPPAPHTVAEVLAE